ncbi:MAG: hypothetical protein U1F57_01450 [bacterium]
MKLIPRLFFVLICCLLLSACISSVQNTGGGEESEGDPPEVVIGERLFIETRFAQFFKTHSSGNFNAPLAQGDPVMDTTQTINGILPGPFKGQSMNCRACHLVDEQLSVMGGGMRTYDDFARRSPIPEREDGKIMTPRNSPPLVNSTLAHSGDLFLHFDGEFSTIEDLVHATLTGRNYGWLPNEENQALQHIADVVRFDDGTGALAATTGGLSYQTILLGKDLGIPHEFLIPPEFRIDVAQASNEEIVAAVSRLVGAYVKSLIFSQGENGEFNGSPYDVFLKKNNLPAQPDPGESNLQYGRRLSQLVNSLSNPQFVSASDGAFQFHTQEFIFGPQELEGLKTFLREPTGTPLPPATLAQGKVGNCIACHAPPSFSDFKFHNTGVAQEEYDFIHGTGKFAALSIPTLADRQANPDAYLPASSQHPNASGIFVDVPSFDKPGHTDLGLWNRYANADAPVSQASLNQLLCQMFGNLVADCTPDNLLPLTIGLFKTPGLRDLGHSGPYMHNGEKDGLEDVIRHYIQFSNLSRAGQMVNPPAELQGLALTEQDIQSVTAFLRALNEDYN